MIGSNIAVIFVDSVNEQEAQLSQRDHVTHYVSDTMSTAAQMYTKITFGKACCMQITLKVTNGHSNSRYLIRHVTFYLWFVVRTTQSCTVSEILPHLQCDCV